MHIKVEVIVGLAIAVLIIAMSEIEKDEHIPGVKGKGLDPHGHHINEDPCPIDPASLVKFPGVLYYA
jgi:hypothetical protein